MPKTPISAPPGDHLSALLSGLPAVREVVTDAATNRVFLICEGAEPEGALLSAARNALRAGGVDPAGVELQVAYLAAPQPARRVRFVGVELRRPRAGAAEAEVTLEWDGEMHRGRAEGEASAAGEMRTCGNATLRALEEVVSSSTRFNLVGIKAIRIFDTDLVSVLLHSPELSHGLIGASLVTQDVPHACALAVLNATNRVLGNLLATGD